MKTKILFIALMTMTLSFAQTSKAEINQIIKEQSDGIITPAQKGVSTVYNDGTSAVKTVYNDIKSLSPKIESAIKSLATELKTTTNALWSILVKQQLVWSICFLILTLSAILNWFLFYKRTQTKLQNIQYITLKRDMLGDIPNPKFDTYYFKKIEEYPGDIRTKEFIKGVIGEEEYSCPQLIGDLEKTAIQHIFKYTHLILCLTLSYFSFIHFSDMLTGFINPEFGALKTIAELAIKLK